MSSINFNSGDVVPNTWFNEVDAHTFDQDTVAHTAAHISVTPAGTISSTEVQSALEELDTDISGKADKTGETFTGPVSVPAGASGTQVPQAQEVALLASTQFSFRNKVVNGNFAVNQDAVSGTVSLSAGAYGHDQWKAGASGCTYTFASSGGVTTLTISAGSLIQPIEGAALRTGTYVLSWTGTSQGKIGAGSYGASGISSSLTGGTNTTIEFNTGTLSLVQLEPGTVATEFEYLDPLRDLQRCTYFWWRGSVYWSGQATSAGRAGAQVSFPSPMRTSTPTLANWASTAANGFPTTVPSQLGLDRYGVTLDKIATSTVADGRWAGTFTMDARL